jgi:hypothetical protein
VGKVGRGCLLPLICTCFLCPDTHHLFGLLIKIYLSTHPSIYLSNLLNFYHVPALRKLFFLQFYFILFFIFILFICAYNVWVISPPSPTPSLTPSAPSLSPLPPHYLAETILPLSLILLKRKYKQ